MIKNYEFYKNIGFFNQSGVDITVYYDTKYNKLVALDGKARILKHYVKTPYDSFKYHAMKRFWDILDNESLALAESYTERRGFFQFMRETGLIEFFDEAYAAVAEEIVHLWETENHLNIDWANIEVA